MIIQLADPVIIEWIMATARSAAEQAGRDPAALQCIVGAPSKVSDDLAACREEVRWFPAMVSNHVMDLIERYGYDSDIPSELTDFVKARKFYDYKDHSRVGAAHGEFVTDEICDRFCVIGTAEQCAEKLRALEAVGVDQFNVYLMTNAQEETLAAYGRDVIPRFARCGRGLTHGAAARRPGNANRCVVTVAAVGSLGSVSSNGSVVTATDLTRRYGAGRDRGRGAARRLARDRARQADRRHGAVRVGQVDADAHPRRPRQADERHGHDRRRGDHRR